jgi:hypothetical protein
MKAFSAPQCFIFSATLMSSAIISSHSSSFATSSTSIIGGAFAPSTLQKALSWSMVPSSSTTITTTTTTTTTGGAVGSGEDSRIRGISHGHSTSNIHSGSCYANNQSGESSVAESATQVFRAEDHVAFERDGFLVVSGLLDEQLLEEFIHAGHAFAAQAKKTNSYFSIIDMGLIFQAGKDDTDSAITDAFRRVAFHSKLPQAAAELMQIPASQNVRVLR